MRYTSECIELPFVDRTLLFLALPRKKLAPNKRVICTLYRCNPVCPPVFINDTKKEFCFGMK